MDIMSRYSCDRAGQIGESGALRREGWGAGRGYSKVSSW
jgi:hypothetical protein